MSPSTRWIYLTCLRRLLRDLAPEAQPGLILTEDFPPRPPYQRKAAKKDRRQPECRRLNESILRTHPLFGEIFDSPIQTLATTLGPDAINTYRVAARRFLSYLQADFPQVRELSELRRDPHLLGWVRGLYQQHPPLSNGTREHYLYKLRSLFQNLVDTGHPLPSNLILAEDFPRRRAKKKRDVQLSHFRFGELFEASIQILATTLRPGTIAGYRTTARRFLSYLQTDFPQMHQLAELRRDPHLVGWFRRLCLQQPSLSNTSRQNYLLQLRRLLEDLACAGHPLQPGLILTEDLPPRPQYLPRALSFEDDQRLQQELRRRNDLLSNALLLTRATGLRIGECIGLAVNCLRSVGPDQWALQVPLGKLRTERLVPVDQDVRQIVGRIVILRAQAPASQLVQSAHFLLPRSRPSSLYQNLCVALKQAAHQAGCSDYITSHRLRHTYATEMIRLGVSLPAVMKLLGHKTVRMTLRYVQVTQRDLQREFHLARQNAAQVHHIPQLSLPSVVPAASDLPGILRTLAATRHLLEMYRRQLKDDSDSCRLRRLDKRLHTVALELGRFATAEK